MWLCNLFKKKKASYRIIKETSEKSVESETGRTYIATYTTIEVNGKTHTELAYKDERSLILTMDEGFLPIAGYRDFLVNDMGFNQTEAYGITDITYKFTYNNDEYRLWYWSDEDTISFLSYSDDPDKVHTFRGIAAKLYETKTM